MARGRRVRERAAEGFSGRRSYAIVRITMSRNLALWGDAVIDPLRGGVVRDASIPRAFAHTQAPVDPE
jgi:hypothetical protein